MLSRVRRRRRRRRRMLLGLLALVVLLCAGGLLGTKYLYDGQFTRAEAPDMTAYVTYDDVADRYPREVVQFPSGNNLLTGYLYGTKNTKGLVVIAHGLGGGAANYLAETMYFVDRGWQVFAYDCTGSHASEGTSTKGLPQSLLDLDAALTYINTDSTLGNLPIMLFGHSWGGYAVAAILQYEHDIAASVSIAGFNAPTPMALEEGVKLFGPVANVLYPFVWTYQTLLFGSAASATAVDGINGSETPVMIVHGSEDETVRYSGASIIARRDKVTNPNVTFLTMDAPGQNGHTNLLRSAAAQEYIDAMNKEYKALYDRYSGEIPHDVRAAFYAGVDKSRTSERNLELMDAIHRFYEQSLGL